MGKRRNQIRHVGWGRAKFHWHRRFLKCSVNHEGTKFVLGDDVSHFAPHLEGGNEIKTSKIEFLRTLFRKLALVQTTRGVSFSRPTNNSRS